jgi:aryl-alcohol dehydrogenase-like predicted oxidoreductase
MPQNTTYLEISQMNYAYFGSTGIQVSRLCLGTMSFGNEADRTASIALMNQAFDAGVNFFDTADVYCAGETERIVGHWMKDRRDEIILASKTYFPAGDGLNDKGSSRRHIILGVEASLKRLQTDYLDILYLHHWDEHTGIEQSLAAASYLVDHGMVHYVAVSNFAAWQCQQAVMAARAQGLAPITAIQPMYSLIKRTAEIEILPMAQAQGLAVCPYSPMGSGMLTGKYHRNEKGRITANPMYKERYRNTDYMKVAGRFVAYAQEHEYNPAALSVAWVNAHPAVTASIVGVWNPEQLATALSATEIALTPEEWRAIGELGIPQPHATDREDMAHLKITSKKDGE